MSEPSLSRVQVYDGVSEIKTVVSRKNGESYRFQRIFVCFLPDSPPLPIDLFLAESVVPVGVYMVDIIRYLDAKDGKVVLSSDALISDLCHMGPMKK